MPTYKFSNFPKPVVIFGNKKGTEEYKKLQENMCQLNKVAATASEALIMGATFFAKLGAASLCAGHVAIVMTVLTSLIGEVDRLYEELKNLEEKIFNTIIEGKMRALRSNLRNLQDAKTPETQKISEIVSAISQLNEILPVFEKEDSIFRERYYLGAPFFVYFCGILKAVSLIAELTPGYNTGDLSTLKAEFQKVLDWYRDRCIGRRLASCYVRKMLAVPGCEWTHDWRNHYEKYGKYYLDNATFPWVEYAMDLGGTGWKLWCGKLTYCNLIDLWDARPAEDVKFETFEIKDTSGLPAGLGYGAATAVVEIKYHRDVLSEYRKRVETVMLEFFDAANLISQAEPLNVENELDALSLLDISNKDYH